jgi:hypothetical protein
MSFNPGSRYITAALIEDGYQVTADDIAYQCRVSQQAYANDTVWFGGGAGVSFFASLAAYGAVGSLTAAVAIPALALVGCSIAAWQVSERTDHRETEARLFRRYPQLAQQITKAIESGANTDDLSRGVSNAIATASRDGSRSMPALSMDAKASESWDGDNNAFNDPIVPENVSADEGSTQAEEAPKTESATIAPTEFQPIAAASPSMQHIVSPVWNPAQDLGENPQSALIVGTPGSGKGMTVSNAVRVLKYKMPDLHVFVIDPKADPKERGYWDSIADTYCAFSLMNCLDPDDGAEWLIDCMARFQSITGPKLCIFDEMMTASTELQLANKDFKAMMKLKKFVVGLIGQGDSQDAWLWCMTQSPQVQDLGMGGGVRANLRVIALVSPKNITAVEAIVSTKLIPAPDGGVDKLRKIMANSPVGTAVFDGKIGRWLPMPKLENFSGYDRNSRSAIVQESSTFQTIAVQDDPAPDDFSDLPDIFRAVALMAMARNITASDKSFIVNDLKEANELKSSDPLAARERLSKYVA